jgi:type 2 lantibiotic biosynthesis protein LanM
MKLQPSPTPSAFWYKAHHLTERIAYSHNAPPAQDSINMERARRRLEAWRTQEPFNHGDYFERRLASERIVENDFLYLLGHTGETTEVPDWAAKLEAAFLNSPRPEERSFSFLWESDKESGFLVVIQPLIEEALHRLLIEGRKMVKSTPEAPFDPEMLPAMFFPNLRRRMVAMLKRTLVLELNVARLEGHLEGNTPEERFRSFLRRLKNPDVALQLLREYPVLARQISIRIQQWLTAGVEFLSRLCEDWQKIGIEFFSDSNPGLLVEAQGGLGDPHKDGKSVMICKFDSGACLVYKPRSLTLDLHFQELLSWINERNIHLPFRILKLLDRGCYGWMEFVAANPCHSAVEVRRFYERQGGYLALLYALDASDFHYENIIAAGEHPVLIDLEALFHPRIGAEYADSANGAAGKVMDYSVLRVGLLPRRVFGDEESDGVDVSGLGGEGGQLVRNGVSIENDGTDVMRFTRASLLMSGQSNRPTLAGTEIKVQDYGDAIVSGFTAVYQALLECRRDLFSMDGPMERFAQDRVRVVLRPTQVYTALLWESFHPDVLRDALDRDRLFDRLWVAVQDRTYLDRVIAAERYDLLIGDIPIFTTQAGSSSLWDSTDHPHPDFFPQCGLETARQRLFSLDAADLGRQIWFIRASLASLTLAETMEERPYPTIVDLQEATRKRLLMHALGVGNRLKELAFQDHDSASWVGVGLVNERSWSVLPLGPNLYDGLSGVILFLAYLSSVTGCDDYRLLARKSLVTLRRQLNEFAEIAPVGAFSGLSGIIYLFCHLKALWGDEEMTNEAANLIRLLPTIVEKDQYLDVMAGSAGCLAVLLGMHKVQPSEEVLSHSIQCGRHLLKEARPMPHGIGWTPRGVAAVPLTGFSHGAAGIAWALSQLANVGGDDRFRNAAMDAIAYERSLFLPELGNWPDLRHEPINNGNGISPRCGVMWCHGSAGIGLGRLAMEPFGDQLELRAEIDAALNATETHGFGFNHCLCHGDLGNLELFLHADLKRGGAAGKVRLNHHTSATLASIEAAGWLCGTPSKVETPGLMTGLAGIGYQLLRLAEPSKVPSVLCLAPPAE